MTHLTNDFTDEQLATLAARLQNRDIKDPSDIQRFIDILGDTVYHPAQSIIESYLDHYDPFVRAESIRALASWFKSQEHKTTCEQIIKDETDFDARIAAITGLGSLALAANDPSGLRILARIVRDRGEKIGYRETAYQGLLHFKGVHPREHPHLSESQEVFEAAVDWELVSRAERQEPL